MTYIAADASADGVAKVIYDSKNGKISKTFDAPVSSTGQALDWLAQLVTHIPNKGESAGGGSDIMDSTPINRVDYGKKPVPMIKFRP